MFFIWNSRSKNYLGMQVALILSVVLTVSVLSNCAVFILVLCVASNYILSSLKYLIVVVSRAFATPPKMLS